MKKLMLVGFLAFLATMLALTPLDRVQAQSGIGAVQQNTQRLDSDAICVSSNTSAGTVTFTPPGAQYVYLTEIDFESGQSTTGIAAAAAPTTISISNISGSPLWTMASGAATTPGTNTQTFSVFYPTGLKSQTPGTVVTVTLPTIPGNTFMRVNACAYYGN